MKPIVSSSLFIIAIMTMMGCVRPKNNGQHIFLYQELQDSVEYFVQETLPLLEDASECSLFTTIIFRIDKEDTLVIISPANIPFICQSGRDTIIGAGMLGGRICEVVCSGTNPDSLQWLGSIVNDNNLTVPRKSYDFQDCSPIIEQEDYNYPIVEKAAKLRQSYILNRPNHLKRAR